MEEYPKTLAELEREFATEEACARYLFQLRWPDGFVCPRCGGTQCWTTKRALSTCAQCQYQLSVKAGTIFAGSRSSLTTWFRAIWWVTSQKNGASAKGLQRILGLGSYKTAWTWLHKLRRAMVRPGRDRLAGVVEVDETRLSSFFTLTGPEHAVHAAIQASARYFNDGVGSSLPMSLPFICLADEVRGKSFFAIATISSNFS